MDIGKLMDELKRDEGVRLTPYFDSAEPPRATIGVGRNLSDKGLRLGEVMNMLQNDIGEVILDLDQHCAWWRRMDEIRQRVLANMCFNLGISRLLKFTTTLALMQQKNYDAAADAMLESAWAKQVGIRATRLSDMMRRGGV